MICAHCGMENPPSVEFDPLAADMYREAHRSGRGLYWLDHPLTAGESIECDYSSFYPLRIQLNNHRKDT